MTKTKLIELLNNDLRNEYAHMHFYLLSASLVQGLHREELRELFADEAAEEMKHVRQFTDLIVGMGGQPECLPNVFPSDLTKPEDIIKHALFMETEVVNNYVSRINDAQALGGVDGKWVEILLEEQVMKSRQDIDHYQMMLRGL